MNDSSRLPVGVHGPTGYTGRELIRLLADHPRVRIAFATSESEAGLPLGAEGEVVAARPEAGVVTVRFGGQETTMAREAAEKLLVEPVDSSS